MLTWSIIFFSIALLAALFGFGGIASSAAGVAQVLFFIFLIAFAISLIAVYGGSRGRAPKAPL